MKMLTTAAFAAAIAAAPSAAATIVETSDAGVTMPTAFAVGTALTNATVLAPGEARRLRIEGTLAYEDDPDTETDGDFDLFRIVIARDGVYRFTGTFSPEIDDNLLLFNELGQGLAGDDDDDGDVIDDDSEFDSLDAVLQLRLAAGVYYLGYGDNNTGAFIDEAAAAAIDDFLNNDDGILDEPTAERLGLIGAEDTGPFDRGDYVIFAEAVPEPAALALLGMGMLGVAARRRRR